jgi:Leucine-rich repeat (LRR) protein
MNYRNIDETSEELMNLFINCPEVIELDLSNNMLSKLPLEISFLTCLTKLDIRNNAFSNVIKQIYNNILNQI